MKPFENKDFFGFVSFAVYYENRYIAEMKKKMQEILFSSYDLLISVFNHKKTLTQKNYINF